MTLTLENAVIILVEDDPNSFLAIVDLLKLDGATTVHACVDGNQALELAETLSQVDLFLLDIYMPGETGYSLIKQIRQQPRFNTSKVVALTASVMYDDIRRVKKAGFDGFIGKPVRPARFANQIRQILAGESVWEWR